MAPPSPPLSRAVFHSSNKPITASPSQTLETHLPPTSSSATSTTTDDPASYTSWAPQHSLSLALQVDGPLRRDIDQFRGMSFDHPKGDSMSSSSGLSGAKGLGGTSGKLGSEEGAEGERPTGNRAFTLDVDVEMVEEPIEWFGEMEAEEASLNASANRNGNGNGSESEVPTSDRRSGDDRLGAPSVGGSSASPAAGQQEQQQHASWLSPLDTTNSTASTTSPAVADASNHLAVPSASPRPFPTTPQLSIPSLATQNRPRAVSDPPPFFAGGLISASPPPEERVSEWTAGPPPSHSEMEPHSEMAQVSAMAEVQEEGGHLRQKGRGTLDLERTFGELVEREKERILSPAQVPAFSIPISDSRGAPHSVAPPSSSLGYTAAPPTPAPPPAAYLSPSPVNVQAPPPPPQMQHPQQQHQQFAFLPPGIAAGPYAGQYLQHRPYAGQYLQHPPYHPHPQHALPPPHQQQMYYGYPPSATLSPHAAAGLAPGGVVGEAGGQGAGPSNGRLAPRKPPQRQRSKSETDIMSAFILQQHQLQYSQHLHQTQQQQMQQQHQGMVQFPQSPSLGGGGFGLSPPGVGGGMVYTGGGMTGSMPGQQHQQPMYAQQWHQVPLQPSPPQPPVMHHSSQSTQAVPHLPASHSPHTQHPSPPQASPQPPSLPAPPPSGGTQVQQPQHASAADSSRPSPRDDPPTQGATSATPSPNPEAEGEFLSVPRRGGRPSMTQTTSGGGSAGGDQHPPTASQYSTAGVIRRARETVRQEPYRLPGKVGDPHTPHSPPTQASGSTGAGGAPSLSSSWLQPPVGERSHDASPSHDGDSHTEEDQLRAEGEDDGEGMVGGKLKEKGKGKGKARGKRKEGIRDEEGEGEEEMSLESKTTAATIEAAAKRRKPENQAKFVCELCGETFTRRYNLKGHQRAHRNEKPYACEYEGCGKAFARMHDRKRHELLHLGVRKYHCAPCKRDFVRLDALQRHHRSEVGQACVAQLRASGVEIDYDTTVIPGNHGSGEE